MEITEKDLTGDLEGFPIEVVEGMLQRQFEQAGKVDVTVFQECACAYVHVGGFDWDKTPERHDFWQSVIAGRHFHIFKTGYQGPAALREGGAPDAGVRIPPTLEEGIKEIQKLVFGTWLDEIEATKKTGLMDEKRIAEIAAQTYDERETHRPHLKDQLKELGFYPEPVTVEIKTPKKETKKVKNQHFLFPQVLKSLIARVNVALVGPAGSGKTSMVHNAATALGLSFYSKSVSAQTGVHEFFGYQDANGNFVRTLFREAYEKGGVFLVDEFDAGNPNVLAALNQATANGSCAFPDRMVEKHKDFLAVMAGNTYGTGATAEYVGRNKIDAATLDRFVFIEVPYDENLEMAITTNKAWCRKVQQFRAQAAKKKVKCIISPRATFNGEKLLEAGMDEDFVLRSVIFKNLSEDEIRLLTEEEKPEDEYREVECETSPGFKGASVSEAYLKFIESKFTGRPAASRGGKFE